MRILGALLVMLVLTVPSFAHELDSITAKSAIVIEYDTGEVVYAKNSDEKRPPASTTKIMTALVALDQCGDDLGQMVRASQKAATVGESSIYLVEGETLSLEDMLYGLMMNSGNDAAVAIAEHVGGDEYSFANLMNKKAREVGAKNSHFVNCNGLPNSAHFTTAGDLAKIARVALQNPVFATIVSTRDKQLPWAGHDYNRVLSNTNKLLGHFDGANGVKTGYTKIAGSCLVSSAKRGDQQFICVLLNSGSVWEESKKLLDYAFNNYKKVDLYAKGEEIEEIGVTGGLQNAIKMVTEDKVTALIDKNREKDIQTKVLYKTEGLFAPVKKGEVIGRIDVVLDGKVIAKQNLLAKDDVKAKTVMRSFINQILEINNIINKLIR